MPKQTTRSHARHTAVLQAIADRNEQGGVSKSEIQAYTKELWGKQIGIGNLRAALLQHIEGGEISFFVNNGAVRYYKGPQWGRVARKYGLTAEQVEPKPKKADPKAPPPAPKYEPIIHCKEEGPDYLSGVIKRCAMPEGHAGKHVFKMTAERRAEVEAEEAGR